MQRSRRGKPTQIAGTPRTALPSDDRGDVDGDERRDDQRSLSPMLMTPDFSAKIPPSPASTMGAASMRRRRRGARRRDDSGRSPAIESRATTVPAGQQTEHRRGAPQPATARSPDSIRSSRIGIGTSAERVMHRSHLPRRRPRRRPACAARSARLRPARASQADRRTGRSSGRTPAWPQTR